MRGLFENRNDAGEQLADRLRAYDLANAVVFALPRGGVPIGFKIAEALHIPLDVILVRKIGAPMQKELAIGAIADGNPPYIFVDRQMTLAMGVTDSYIDAEIMQQIAEIERRRNRYGVITPPPSLENKVVIVVDDGIATGATVRVALQALRQRNPDRLILAIPVAAKDSVAVLKQEVDQIICLESPEYFPGVGAFYHDFTQVDDSVVIDLLQQSRHLAPREK